MYDFGPDFECFEDDPDLQLALYDLLETGHKPLIQISIILEKTVEAGNYDLYLKVKNLIKKYRDNERLAEILGDATPRGWG